MTRNALLPRGGTLIGRVRCGMVATPILQQLERRRRGRAFGMERERNRHAERKGGGKVITKTKRIEWSYPTSPNAEKFRFGASGCYTVEIIDVPKLPVSLAGFAGFADAQTFAEMLPLPWDRHSHDPSVMQGMGGAK